MKRKNLKSFFYSIVSMLCGLLFYACQDVDDLQQRADLLKLRLDALEQSTNEMNESVAGLMSLLEGKQVVGITPSADGNGYKVELSDGSSYQFMVSDTPLGFVPLLGINADGNWTYQVSESSNPIVLLDKNNHPISAYPKDEEGHLAYVPQLQISEDGFWMVSYDEGVTFRFLMDGERKVSALAEVNLGTGSVFSRIYYNKVSGKLELTMKSDGRKFMFQVIDDFYLKVTNWPADGQKVFTLGETATFEVEQSKVKEAVIQASDGWKVMLSDTKLEITAPEKNSVVRKEEIHLIITSAENYVRVVALPVKLLNSKYPESTAKAFVEFATKDPHNVLLDFSYAGYMHGEKEPPSVDELKAKGYKLYDVTDYGAVANDGKSDREAFLKTLEAAGATRKITSDGNIRVRAKGDKLNAVIYFPEGEFILQGEKEEVNQSIHLTMGNFVICGAGRNKTKLHMKLHNLPANKNMWSTPSMIEIKHYSAPEKLTEVTANAAKGDFTVEVGSTVGLKAGQWVRLYLKNNAPELVNKELAPYSVNGLNAQVEIKKSGVEVLDYHQIKSVVSNKVTFYEPLMHEVEARWKWELQKFPHYENVGVEDLTFQAVAKEGFQHHVWATNESGEKIAYDSSCKMFDYGRLTNSWLRRCNFISVSEACSMVNSANISAYDIEISGNRGHSAIRSQGSSRVFIGKVYDHSSGMELTNTGGSQLGTMFFERAGQYHACGVSKQSLGAVIWNVHWGDDSCFESHASQPRATLIDHCQGAFIKWRQGGDLVQLPNHLNDLTIWNMNVTRTKAEDGDTFLWWDTKSIWWRNLPPVLVGFHGEPITFGEGFKQVKRLESNGKQVEPASLYEAQLKERLGYVPAWLIALKN
ncbi:hypothetical protein, secreted [gut metagenome]|uniref:DUF4955 domain-containing protein n=1 Tax=gut metagenome TaxID=749906 RepID=J9H204_9ZZZZ